MNDWINKNNNLIYKINTNLSSKKNKNNFKIKTNNKQIFMYNNLTKIIYINNKKNLYQINSDIDKKYFRFYINKPLNINDTELGIYYNKYITKYTIDNTSKIFYLIQVDTINKDAIPLTNNIDNLISYTKNDKLLYKYELQQPFKNEKDSFDIKKNVDNSLNKIHIKTNKYTKAYLLELVKMNLPKVDAFLIPGHITYKNFKYISEAKSVLDTFYHFLLSCIFCEKNANSNFIIRIGISKVSYQLIYLISQYYNNIIIDVDKYRSPNDSQLYIFCKEFRGISESEFNELLDLYDSWCKKQPYLGFYINSHYDNDRENYRIIREKTSGDTTEFVESIFENEIPQAFVDKINNHISQILDRQNKFYEYLEWFDKNKDSIDMEELDKIQIKVAVACFIEYNIPIKPMYSELIYGMLTTRQIKDKQGQLIKLHSNIKRDEGDYLYNTVRQNKFKVCVEVGMAYGMSALFICRALRYNDQESMNNDKHILISIDPNQSTQWQGLGVENLKRDKLIQHHKLLETTSYNALPSLLNEYEEKVDFIFIDGWHTFDYTLVDFFYSDLLLKVGGYIVLDDALHAGPAKVVRYLVENYTHYKKLDVNVVTIAVFKKMKKDDREWSFHKNF